MTICREEEKAKGGAYPRSCPTCKFGPCSRDKVYDMRTLERLSKELEKVDVVIKEAQTKKIVLLSELEETLKATDALSKKYSVH